MNYASSRLNSLLGVFQRPIYTKSEKGFSRECFILYGTFYDECLSSIPLDGGGIFDWTDVLLNRMNSAWKVQLYIVDEAESL